jgi:CubicO group peptidase (beta-lactamase class C family)
MTYGLGIGKFGIALSALMIACAPLPATAETMTVDPGAVGMKPEALNDIREAMRIAIKTGQIPGAVVLVERDGKIAFLDAQGSFKGKTLQPTSIFSIASLSKPVTAVAVMMLVEDGKINLNDPISKFVPELGGKRIVRVLKKGSPPPPFSPMPGFLPEAAPDGPAVYDMVPAEREFTIKDLLTHTSGVQIFGVPNAIPNMPRRTPNDTLATAIPRLGLLPLEFQPGSRWGYSNGLGFDILGRVVEVASGMSFSAFVHRRILDPLGMTDTDFGVAPQNLDRALALPFEGAKVQTTSEIHYYSGGGGLNSTAIDYAKFANMLANGGTVDGHHYLKPETIKEMTTNQVSWMSVVGYPPMGMPSEAVRFGLGMLVLTTPPAAGSRMPEGSFGWDGVGTRRFWANQAERLALIIWVPTVGPSGVPLQREVESAVMSSIGK